ncbi:MAG: hypothetical protein OEX18_01540 [Candidatus Krumholzibacteria bacterium]|nr:hypothetical protein [Candidatus Krumholzibacteria bacterium]MDH4335946.1 hypothetical protein [Candidatus Krumholzibacteria bacterium]MDH5268478.1 hypothetical protein [Candidatus Krumholzibacteria bacterium]
MKRILTAYIALLALGGWAPHARAESSTGGAFLVPGYGARAAGMAGAVSAVIDDEGAIDWNPARLGLVTRTLGASYVQLVPGASLDQADLAFVTPLCAVERGVAKHAAGVMLTNLSADIAGLESYSENHLRMAYAFTPQPLLSVAIAGKLFFSQSGVSGFDAWGSSVDFAGYLSLSEHWDAAVVGKDLFSRYSFDDGSDAHKESSVVVGVATSRVRVLTLSADAVRQYSTWTRGLLGAETDYIFSHIALRGGVAFHAAGESRTTPSFGASLRAFDTRLVVHYAATVDDEQAFGTTHRFTLAVRL